MAIKWVTSVHKNNLIHKQANLIHKHANLIHKHANLKHKRGNVHKQQLWAAVYNGITETLNNNMH